MITLGDPSRSFQMGGSATLAWRGARDSGDLMIKL
jgi:hypothetical protein